MSALHDTIVRPVVTEKSSAAYQLRKEYAFEVHPSATKHEIREALLQLFGVNALKVRTMVMRRNTVVRGRTKGLTSRWKKAIVILKEGQTLPVFEG
jgi:large subunit ribosomal protein L23